LSNGFETHQFEPTVADIRGSLLAASWLTWFLFFYCVTRLSFYRDTNTKPPSLIVPPSNRRVALSLSGRDFLFVRICRTRVNQYVDRSTSVDPLLCPPISFALTASCCLLWAISFIIYVLCNRVMIPRTQPALLDCVSPWPSTTDGGE